MVLSAVILFLSLVIDRVLGDPHSSYHPIALLGRIIAWWGNPLLYPQSIHKFAGIALWFATVCLFALPFLIFEQLLPWPIYLIVGPFLLKTTFAWRSLEDHRNAVLKGLDQGLYQGRKESGMMVSRDTSALDREHVLSAVYESMSENLVDSVIAPIMYYGIGEFAGIGLACAAFYRAANTMDAMLGYRDTREKLGWCAARADDLLNYVPARLTGALLLVYFGFRGRFRDAYTTLIRDARKRPGYNGGIPMAVIAGGTGVVFEKLGVYRIGRAEYSLEEKGSEVVKSLRWTIAFFSVLLIGALFLFHNAPNI